MCQLRQRGAAITFEFVDGAAHGIFNERRVSSTVRSTPSGIRLHMTTEADPGVPDRLFERLLSRIR